jgi:flagellar hook-length control protein FliK
MNAAPPVSQAQPSSDAVQPEAPASAAAANTRAGSKDFAAALSDAGGKPARKSAANKQHDPAPSGSALPVPGNQPPPGLAPPPPAKTEASAAAAAAVADAAAIVKGAQGGAPASVPGAIAGASTAPGDPSGATTGLNLPNLDPAAPPAPGAAAPPVLATAPTAAISVDAPAPSPANGPTATGSGLRMPHAASSRTPAVAETSKPATGPAVPTGNTRTVKLSDTTANLKSTGSADSAPSSIDANAPNDSTLSNGPATAGADAASQAAIAGAIVQGTSAPEADSADLPPGAAAVSGSSAGAALAAGLPAAALAQAAAVSAAAISAAVTAAAAASVAQAVFAAAGTSAADKRAHGATPDSLSGASNDGSVGAAQLLTSNTSTDTAPMPTFKVAAGVDTAQFGQGVADRVSLMMDGNLTSARLQVNPPALGPIEVRIALQGGHAQVWLSSHSAVTRDALESSSSKLREMLGSQGFSQVSVDISQRSFQERSPQSQAYESAPAISGDVPVLAQASASMSRSASGLLDAYA